MLKIMVLDDEEQIRKVLAKFLAKMGFEVIEAASGEEAIGLLRSEMDIDLMIMDMEMPKVTGLDVLKEKNNLNNLVPVIILTGSIDAKKYIPVLKELGLEPDDFVVKPVDLFLLLDVIKKKLHIQ
jgi:CheY-like chemotaxis protein